MPTVRGAEIKVVGKSGQISLGKSYAGKTLRVERQEDGRIVLTAVAVVPESQLWTLEERERSSYPAGPRLGCEDLAPKHTDLDALIGGGRRSLAARVAAGADRVRLDLNSPVFQDVFFRLEVAELKQVVAGLRRLSELDWTTIYRHTGFRWEAIDHLKAPNGAKVHSLPAESEGEGDCVSRRGVLAADLAASRSRFSVRPLAGC